MDTPHRNPWEDPNVRAALDAGRLPGDISLICCPRCGNFGYYNDGSHWDCTVCEQYGVSGERLDAMIENDEVITLDDYASMIAEREEQEMGGYT